MFRRSALLASVFALAVAPAWAQEGKVKIGFVTTLTTGAAVIGDVAGSRKPLPRLIRVGACRINGCVIVVLFSLAGKRLYSVGITAVASISISACSSTKADTATTDIAG